MKRGGRCGVRLLGTRGLACYVDHALHGSQVFPRVHQAEGDEE